jgi:hypothetical protein
MGPPFVTVSKTIFIDRDWGAAVSKAPHFQILSTKTSSVVSIQLKALFAASNTFSALCESLYICAVSL